MAEACCRGFLAGSIPNWFQNLPVSQPNYLASIGPYAWLQPVCIAAGAGTLRVRLAASQNVIQHVKQSVHRPYGFVKTDLTAVRLLGAYSDKSIILRSVYVTIKQRETESVICTKYVKHNLAVFFSQIWFEYCRRVLSLTISSKAYMCFRLMLRCVDVFKQWFY